MENSPRNQVRKPQLTQRALKRSRKEHNRGSLRRLLVEVLESRLLLTGGPPYTITGTMLTLVSTDQQAGSGADIYLRDNSSGDLAYSLDGSTFSPIDYSDGTQVLASSVTEVDSQFTGTTFLTGSGGAEWTCNSQGLSLAGLPLPGNPGAPLASFEIDLPMISPSSSAFSIQAPAIETNATITSQGGAMNITSIENTLITSSISTQGGALTISAGDNVEIEANVSTSGGALSVTATNTLDIGDQTPGIVLSTEDNNSTGQTAGSSGVLTLAGSTISTVPASPPASPPVPTRIIADLASSGTAFSAGNVTITATNYSPSTVYNKNSSAITLQNVEIKGDEISISSDAQNVETYDPSMDQPQDANTIPGDILGLLASLRIEAAPAIALNSSTIDFESGTTINSSGDLTVTSNAQSTGNIIGLGLIAPLSADVTEATSDVEIDSGATLAAPDGNVTISSDTDNDQSTTAQVMDPILNEKVPINLVIAVSYATSQATLNVNAGALVSAGESASLTAQNTKNLSTSVSGGGSSDLADAAVAVTYSTTDAEAHVAGTVHANDDASVQATSNTTTNITGATTQIGDSFFSNIASGESSAVSDLYNQGSQATGSVSSFLGNLFNAAVDGVSGVINTFVTGLKSSLNDGLAPEIPAPGTGLNGLQSLTTKLGVAGAIAVAIHSNKAIASVDSGGVLQSHGTAEVESSVTDPIQINSTSLLAPDNSQGSTSGSKQTGISVAVLYGQYTNTSQAYVNSDATVDATDKLTVKATTSVPYFQSFTPPVVTGGGIVSSVLSKLNDDLGLPALLSSWAQSAVYNSGGGTNNSNVQNGVAGAVDVMMLSDTTDAYIGSGALVNQNSAYESVPDTTQDVSVSASTSVTQVHMSGELPPLLKSVYIKSPSQIPLLHYLAQSKSLGGSVLVTDYQEDTEAYIEPGAQIDAHDLSVKANTTNVIVGAAASGNASSGNLAVAGSFGVSILNDKTLADIQLGTALNASGAPVGTSISTTGSIDVNAEDNTADINVAGEVGVSSNVGIGISAAVNVVQRDTEAWIGPAPGATTPAEALRSGSVDSEW